MPHPRLCWLLLLLFIPIALIAKKEGTVTLTKSVLLDKIKGGWAGQTIGCAYGGPTEFCYRGVMIPDDVEITYPEHHLKGYFDNAPSLFDDVYMDLTFVEVFTRLGLDAPADSFATAFAYAPYPLWHANQQGRYNVLHGLMPPESGYWKNNPHADCIDYQIESDYAGLMSPGMPNAASEISDKIGHIMNYGDGWYGGVFIGAMYALAFVENDVATIVEKALQTIPKGSRFRKRLDSVVKWYHENPTDWKRAWNLYNQMYSEDLGCPELILAPGNIDATMNSAYVAMGLLYGQGDFGKTMEIATRCGQDSDCNPSSAAGVLATMLGYSNIPEKWMPNLREVEDRNFAYMKISLNDTYKMVYDLALRMIERNGGKVKDGNVTIKVQKPKSVRMEQGFMGISPHLLTSGIQYLGTDDAEQNTFSFNGCGIVVYGNISCSDTSYEAQLEVTVDGKTDRVVSLCSNFNKRTADAIYWNYDLKDGTHKVSFKLLNPCKGVNIKANRVIYYVTDNHLSEHVS
ncbi:MAG: ADP-ribosylglycohydrolase family protein [Bacteroidaceae bacterium]|nr:ADP-ribosylglycohydrolase family protein [Bacteroidaceae bacterium]